jgi:hypothetical protein
MPARWRTEIVIGSKIYELSPGKFHVRSMGRLDLAQPPQERPRSKIFELGVDGTGHGWMGRHQIDEQRRQNI